MTTTTIQCLIVDLAHLQCDLESGPYDDAVAWAEELRLVANASQALVALRESRLVDKGEPDEQLWEWAADCASTAFEESHEFPSMATDKDREDWCEFYARDLLKRKGFNVD
jgi:hypothetical protein